MSACKRCGASILWARTAVNHRMMPIDPGIDPAGNVGVIRRGKTLTDARVITADAPQQPGETPYMPHYATCARKPASKPTPTPTPTKHASAPDQPVLL